MSVADLHNREDDSMIKFLAKFDLTQKERMKFLANRSGLIKIAKNISMKTKSLPMPIANLVMSDKVDDPRDIYEKIAPNNFVNFEDMQLRSSYTYDTSTGIKSLVRVDKETFKVIDLHSSINSASRSFEGTICPRKLRDTLYKGSLEIGGYYWVMVERMKVCSMCKIWMKIRNRYKSSNGKNGNAYSSYCKDCDHKRGSI